MFSAGTRVAITCTERAPTASKATVMRSASGRMAPELTKRTCGFSLVSVTACTDCVASRSPRRLRMPGSTVTVTLPAASSFG